MTFFNEYGNPSSNIISAGMEEAEIVTKKMILAMLVRDASVTEIRAAVQCLISSIGAEASCQILFHQAKQRKRSRKGM